MRKTLALAAALSLGAIPPARADEPPMTREEFCAKLLESRKKAEQSGAGPTFGDRLRAFYEVYTLLTDPGRHAMPETRKVRIPEGMWIRGGESRDASAYRNVIFTLGPPAGAKVDRERYERLQRKLTAESEIVRDLRDEESVPSCVRRAERENFDPAAHLLLQEEISSLRAEKQDSEDRILSRILEPTLAKTRLKWEVVHATDLDALREELRKPDLANVFIIQHATGAGHFVDSSLRQFPIGFFAELSPSLLSLSVYACHGERIAKNYDLERKFAGSPSIHPTRYFFSVAPNDLMGSTEYAPILGAGKFLEKVDRFVSAKLRGLSKIPRETFRRLPKEVKAPRCAVTLSGVEVKSGILGVLLNTRYYLGSFLPAEGKQSKRFDFPCHFFDNLYKTGLHPLVLRDLTLEGNTDADARVGFEVTLEGERASTLSLQKIDHFTRGDGESYSSSIVVWKEIANP